MHQLISLFFLLGCSLTFAAQPNPYIAVDNGTKATTVIISYETESGYGIVTVPPGVNKGVPAFPNGEEVKNINFVLFGGKVTDQRSCGFVFDQYYQFVNIKLQSTQFSSDGENVTVSCSFN